MHLIADNKPIAPRGCLGRVTSSDRLRALAEDILIIELAIDGAVRRASVAKKTIGLLATPGHPAVLALAAP
jgi:hypothetical protein